MPWVVADTSRQYLDYSLAYNQGDYGADETSSLTQLQISYGLVQEKSDFSISIPYLFLSDEYGDDHGPGDITLRAGLELLSNTSQTDNLYGSVAVKLPTADETDGMGTGEMDVGGFIAYTHYSDRISFSLLAGYIVTGDSPQQSYNDIMVYGVSFSKTFTRLSVYASLDGHQNVIAASDDPLEFSLGFYYQLAMSDFLKVEALLGLNDASADYGLSVGYVNWF